MMILDACPYAQLLPDPRSGVNVSLLADDASHELRSFDALGWPASLFATMLFLVSAALLLSGRAMLSCASFVAGFLVGLIVSYYMLAAIMDAADASSSPSTSPQVACVIGAAVPLACALACGALAVHLLTLAFACVGLVTGAAAGLNSYVLCFHAFSLGVEIGSRDLVFWLCVFVGALVGAVSAVRAKSAVLSLATAVLGAVGLVAAIDVLALQRMDKRFLWLFQAAQEHSSSPFVYGPALATVAIAIGGFEWQRMQQTKECSSVRSPNVCEGGPNYVLYRGSRSQTAANTRSSSRVYSEPSIE